MLLIPQINFKGDLLLDAYSFSSEEINSVTHVLDKSGIRIINERLTKDKKGRYGLRFLIIALEIMKLERTLKLRFVGREKSTRVSFDPSGGGSSYKCSRIDTPPNNCQTIFADDDKEAAVKCALVANSNNWLGGVPFPGQC